MLTQYRTFKALSFILIGLFGAMAIFALVFASQFTIGPFIWFMVMTVGVAFCAFVAMNMWDEIRNLNDDYLELVNIREATETDPFILAGLNEALRTGEPVHFTLSPVADLHDGHYDEEQDEDEPSSTEIDAAAQRIRDTGGRL